MRPPSPDSPPLDALPHLTWDAVIVGAGPAGGVCAALLAARQWRVLLVEKSPWPRDKACGGCLNAAGLRLLADAGLAHVLPPAAQPLTRFELALKNRPTLAIQTPAGVAIARPEFDARLAAAAVAHGATFLPATAARFADSAAPSAATRTLQLRQPAATALIHARAVLACDGLRGPLLDAEPWARWLPAENARIGVAATLPAENAPVPPDTITMAVGDAGYVGLVRHPGGRLHLGAALDPAACNRRRGPLPVIEDILSAAGIRLPSLAAADLLGTKPLTGRRAAVGGHRVLAVGDACGYVEPFTGEGMAWAIRSALAAVDLLHGDPSVWPADRAARWGRRHAAQVARRQTLCHCLRHLLRRPAASAACVAAARRLPWLPALLARRLSA